jgi:hypothetical protein
VIEQIYFCTFCNHVDFLENLSASGCAKCKCRDIITLADLEREVDTLNSKFVILQKAAALMTEILYNTRN